MTQKSRPQRQYMELAVHVMKNSIAETRKDGKITPFVGAVLVKSDGEVDTAYRGELREGDHAEFTVIEKKNGRERLDGSVIYATLEPCAPGARRPPKVSCARRIVNARIKEVWIGVEDPDPTVARKGIEYLRQNGVVVHMFDRDLQQEIEAANRDFLDQALERAAEATEDDKALPLNTIEISVAHASMQEFSEEAIHFYLEKRNLHYEIGSLELFRHFESLGIIEQQKNSKNPQWVPTGVGLILFGKSPQDRYPHTTIKGKVRYGAGTPVPKSFEGPLVLIVKEIEIWLLKVLHSKVSRESFEREEETVFPIEPLREAVINALAHRDYDDEKSKVSIEIDDDHIIVRSPGLPVEPITVEDMRAFRASSLSRNPGISRVMHKLDYMEESGLGMDTFRELQSSHGLPLPVVSYSAPFLTICFPRNSSAFVLASGIPALKELNEEELKGYQFVQLKGEIVKQEYVRAFELSDKTAQRHLNKMADLGLIEAKGATTDRSYRILWPQI